MGIGFFLIPIGWTHLFHDAYTPTKWLLVYMLVAIGLWSGTIALPRSKNFLIAGGCAIAFYLGSILWNPHNPSEVYMLDLLVGLSLFLLAKREWLPSILFWNRVALLGLGSFGYPNMAAEFYSIGLLLLLYDILTVENRKLKLGLSALGIFALVCLFETECRSAILGLCAGFALLCCKHFGIAHWKKFLIASILLATVAGGGLTFLGAQSEIKKATITLRLTRWLNTVKMIEAHPWTGSGPGSFEFSYLKYANSFQKDPEISEGLILRSPHNGFLEAAAENGIPFLITVLTIIALLLNSAFQSNDRASSLILGVLAFGIVDALFAFPMENAYPFFVLTIFAGMATSDRRPLPFLWISRFGATLILLGTLIFGYAKWVEANAPLSATHTARACALAPSVWKNCMNEVRIHLVHRHWTQARRRLVAILKRTPENFVARKHFAYVLFETGNTAKGCEQIEKYDHLFRGHHALRMANTHICGVAYR